MRSQLASEAELARAGIRARGVLSRQQRFRIYHYAVFARLVEAVEMDFPRTLALLGKRRAARCLEDYVRSTPSMRPSIAELSERFPAFIARRYPKAAFQAREEWESLISFTTQVPKPLASEWIDAISNNPDSLGFRIDSSARMFRVGSRHGLVWHGVHGKNRKRPSDRERKLVSFFSKSRSLAAIEHRGKRGDLTARWIQARLSEWLGSGLLTIERASGDQKTRKTK